MCLTDLDDVVDASYSTDPPTTEATRKTIRDFQYRFRSSIRIGNGQIMEDDEFKRKRNKELKTPLP